jgi:peptide/nickel transport system substrate-binding protein
MKTKKKKWKRAIALITAAMMAASYGSAATVSAEEKTEKVVTFAQSTLWETLNWLQTTSTPTDYVIEEIFDMLFITNTDGTFDPRLADSWEIDGKEVTFHLNENAKWHDGEPVTADDVVYTFQLETSADTSWLRRANFLEGTDDDGIETSEDSVAVKAVDEHTVVLTLKQEADPTRVLSSYLRDTKILPKHLLGDIADADVANADFWDHPIGSGPFKFDSQIDGERIEYVANDDYYLGRPNFDRLVIRFMDSATLAAALLNGEVDITADVSISDLETLQADDNIQIDTITSYQYQDLCINLEDPVFTLNVRKAINAAINKQALVDQLYKGYGEAAKTILPSSHPYYDENITEDSYDPELAKELLEEEGWDESRVLELTVPQGNQARERSAILIQQDLAAVGIQTEIVSMDFATALQNMRDNNYDLLLMGSAGKIDPEDGGVSYFFHTTDEKFTELWDLQTAGLSFEERKPYLDEFQEYYVEQVPGIVLYFPDRICYYNKRLSNIPVTTTDFWINKLSWTWEVEE